MAVHEIFRDGVLIETRVMQDPPATADDVRAEAQRRIFASLGVTTFEACTVKQLNAAMRATELVNIKTHRALTDAEAAEAAALQAMADRIKAIRKSSNDMEGDPPADYPSNARWP
jgi:hypothetical protein